MKTASDKLSAIHLGTQSKINELLKELEKYSVVPYTTTKTQTHAGIQHLRQVILHTLLVRDMDTDTHLIVVPYTTTKTQTHAGIEHLHQVALNTLIERQRQRHVSCDSRVKNRDTDTHLIVVPCTTTKTQPHV